MLQGAHISLYPVFLLLYKQPLQISSNFASAFSQYSSRELVLQTKDSEIRIGSILSEAYFTLQLHKKMLKIEVKYLRSPMEYGYKQIVYQTITLIQEATASEIQ